MKKTLVIGSSVCDVIIHVHKVPMAGEDENIISQSLSMGGCAYNVARILKMCHQELDLFSPIGQGFYGDFVRHHFAMMGFHQWIDSQDQNGCCYCLVDDQGERTFICEHGAEYLYQAKWFDLLDPYDYDQVYVCGLEIEEASGNLIIDFLEKNPHLTIYFAPGPRILQISQDKMKRLLQLHPIIHLNKQEICQYTHNDDVKEAVRVLFDQTKQPIIVTLGGDGCYFYDHDQELVIPAVKADIKNSNGAGDTHIGAIMAYRRHDDWQMTLKKANQMVVQILVDH